MYAEELRGEAKKTQVNSNDNKKRTKYTVKFKLVPNHLKTRTERYKNDIPVLRNGRGSDILDFRPRVAEFNSITISPFHFLSRNFASSGNNPTLVVSPNASSFVGYSYYLPRIDKLVLDSTGELQILEGVSSINPKAPSSIESSMDLATLHTVSYTHLTLPTKA